MDGSLGQHGVVLELGLAERRSVASNDDELGLAGTQALECGLVAQGDCEVLLNLRCSIPKLNENGISYPFRTS